SRHCCRHLNNRLALMPFSRASFEMDNRAEMSPEAAGIAACLMTYSHHACRTECYAMTVHYYRLRDYALQHPECSAIMRIID
ncbi:antirestriction protein, partial [Escherichia coli]|nr:antirestriction protein [Escherichia coli]